MNIVEAKPNCDFYVGQTCDGESSECVGII